MKVKIKTLSDLARQPGSRPKRAACRICLAPESFATGGASSLSGGICRDREACEAVQPPLIGREDCS